MTGTLLRLHVDEGVVWRAGIKGSPECCWQPPGEYLYRLPGDPDMHVRMVGARANAGLIAGLYARQRAGQLGSLSLVTPLICSTAAMRREPDLVLHALQDVTLSPSQGGFHIADASDYAAYALAEAIDGQASWSIVASLLYAHPAWPALSFIRHVDEQACAHLLADVLDPRWFVNTMHPNRSAAMERYLGALLIGPRTDFVWRQSKAT